MSNTQMLPQVETETNTKVDTLPMWNVIILNDEEHSMEFVVELLMQIFSHSIQRSIELTMEIHTQGQAIVCTTSKERAELKREQVISKGRDPRMGARSTGPLGVVIEPA
jgi:ATP-dependent Clp protease adaptor protein ClpS